MGCDFRNSAAVHWAARVRGLRKMDPAREDKFLAGKFCCASARPSRAASHAPEVMPCLGMDPARYTSRFVSAFFRLGDA